MTLLDAEPVLGGTDSDDELTHIACPCSPRYTLCGIVDDVDDFNDIPVVDDVCLVCADLDGSPCPRCGK